MYKMKNVLSGNSVLPVSNKGHAEFFFEFTGKIIRGVESERVGNLRDGQTRICCKHLLRPCQAYIVYVFVWRFACKVFEFVVE